MMEEEKEGPTEDGKASSEGTDSSAPAVVTVMDDISLADGDGAKEVKVQAMEEVDLMREIESFMKGAEEEDDEVVDEAVVESPVRKLQLAMAAAEEEEEDDDDEEEEEEEGTQKKEGEEKAEEAEEETQEALKEKVLDLETHRGQLAAEVMEKDQELDRLEKELGTMKAALKAKEETLAQNKEEAEESWKRLKEETDSKIAELKKQFTSANRDKEAMVMKYAMGEREVIVQRRGKEEAEKKLKAAVKEKEELQNKVKAFTSDKAKVQLVADSRLQDVSVLKKDVERWKEEVKVQEAKACVAASRLKTEVEAHRETRDHLDKTIRHLADTRKEIEVTRKECAEFMQRIKHGEEAKQRQTKTTEIEQSAKLIIDAAAANELEILREKYGNVIKENNGLSVKVQKMEKERLEADAATGKLKEQIAGQKQEISDLLAQVAEMESLRMRLQREEDRCGEMGAESDRLRGEAAELREDMSACRRKEAELLEFTQKLTDKNVTLQSDLTSSEARTSALEAEHARLAGRSAELEAQLSQTGVELEEEGKRRRSETELMARKLAEKAAQVESLTRQTLDAENEVRVLRRKNAAGLKELTRELQTCRRLLDEKQQQQSSSSSVTITAASPTSVSRSSRASSNTSLNRLEPVQPGQESSHNGGGGGGIANKSYSGSNLLAVQEPNGLPTPSFRATERVLMPDSEVLVDKIVKLQRLMAKRQEKLDFMEEHISTLLEEVKKKNKIVQHYVMKAETGALVSTESDRNKLAKIGRVQDQDGERKLSESGGVMASLYTSRLSDSNMTLELSLEINQKLQAVLEDTLLKNITLKENINTLGNEIAKMSVANLK